MSQDSPSYKSHSPRNCALNVDGDAITLSNLEKRLRDFGFPNRLWSFPDERESCWPAAILLPSLLNNNRLDVVPTAPQPALGFLRKS